MNHQECGSSVHEVKQVTPPPSPIKLLNDFSDSDWDAIMRNWRGLCLEETEWTDDHFFKTWAKPALKDLPPKQCLTDVALLCMKFWAFYFGQEDMTSTEVYKTGLACLRTTVIQGTPLINRDDDDGNKNMIGTFRCSSKQISIFKEKTYKLTNGSVFTFNVYEVNNVFQYLMQLAKSKSDEDVQLLINLTSFMFFTCLRLIKKEPNFFDRHIVNRGSTIFSNLFRIKLSFIIPPPNEKFYTEFCKAIPADTMEFRYLCAVLLSILISSEDKRTDKFCQDTCLLALKDNGLALIKWSAKGAAALHVPIDEYLDYLDNELFHRRVNKVRQFLKQNAHQNSWPWSRIFEHSAFCSFAVSECPKFCLIGAYLSISDPQIIEGMLQFKKYKSFMPAASEYAEAVKYVVEKKRTSGTYHKSSQEKGYSRRTSSTVHFPPAVLSSAISAIMQQLTLQSSDEEEDDQITS